MMWVVAILAGGIGAALRFTVDHVLRRYLRAGWPIAVINIVGSLALGAFAGAAHSERLSLSGLAVAAAFCGGFTTFSTAMLDAVQQAQEAHPAQALALLIGVGVLAGVGYYVTFTLLS